MNNIGIQFPKAYDWFIQNKIVGFVPFSQLQPWYFLSQQEMFWANNKWHSSKSLQLLVFARRQDNDDFSCFSIESNKVVAIHIIHGWTKDGFDVIATYTNMWEWFHSVLDDIKEWVDIMGDEIQMARENERQQ